MEPAVAGAMAAQSAASIGTRNPARTLSITTASEFQREVTMSKRGATPGTAGNLGRLI